MAIQDNVNKVMSSLFGLGASIKGVNELTKSRKLQEKEKVMNDIETLHRAREEFNKNYQTALNTDKKNIDKLDKSVTKEINNINEEKAFRDSMTNIMNSTVESYKKGDITDDKWVNNQIKSNFEDIQKSNARSDKSFDKMNKEFNEYSSALTDLERATYNKSIPDIIRFQRSGTNLYYKKNSFDAMDLYNKLVDNANNPEFVRKTLHAFRNKESIKFEEDNSNQFKSIANKIKEVK